MKPFKNLSEAIAHKDKASALKLTLKEKHLPDELFDFPYLSDCILELPELLQFPDDWHGWESLQTLTLKAPKLTRLPEKLFTLPVLRGLKIIETPLVSWPKLAVRQSIALQFLTLKDCGIKELPADFGQLITLRELYLQGNRLSGLPASFVELVHLQRLNLDNNEFVKMPELLKNLPALKHLSADSNAFSEEEKERIQREFHLWF